MKVKGINELICVGKNTHVVDAVINHYKQWRSQPMELVADIRSLPIDDQCRAIFSYLVANVRYQVDIPGSQFVKNPARLLADRVGDCKSFTIFIASCLYCLGVPHIIRFVNFDGGSQYTHVYPVAIDERGEEIILDAVETDANGRPIYDYARPYVRKKEYRF